MITFLRRWSFLVLCLIFSAGCVRWFLERSTEYARVPFQFGTNATVMIARRVTHLGNYGLYILFTREGQAASTGWPKEVPTRLSVSIADDDKVLIDKEVTKLKLARSDWEQGLYSIEYFEVKGPTVLSVTLIDKTTDQHAVAEVSLWHGRGK